MQTTDSNGIISEGEQDKSVDVSDSKLDQSNESDVTDDANDESLGQEEQEEEETEQNSSQNTTDDSTLNNSATSDGGRTKRVRKDIERYATKYQTEGAKPKDEEEDGIGIPLGEIPYSLAALLKLNPEDLKAFHKLVFGRPGTIMMRRKNLKKFNGFPFTKNDDKYQRKLSNFSKANTRILKIVLMVCGLERSGTKDDLVTRAMEFLLDPHDKGLKVPTKKRKSKTPKKSGQKKRKSKGKKESKSKVKNGDNLDDSEASDEDQQNANGVEDDEDEPASEEGEATTQKTQADTDDDDEEMDDESSTKAKKTPAKSKKTPESKKAKKSSDSAKKPKKTPDVKKTKKTADSAKTKKTPKTPETKKAKKAADSATKPKKAKTPDSKPKKAAEPAKRPRSTSFSDSDSDADVPLKKMVKTEPTDSEIEKFIRKLLQSADLEEVTMKKLCQQVYDHYPDHDLSHKKDFIKTTVKEILS